jgi:hypothetical protein
VDILRRFLCVVVLVILLPRLILRLRLRRLLVQNRLLPRKRGSKLSVLRRRSGAWRRLYLPAPAQLGCVL